jgi:hypothetical protein
MEESSFLKLSRTEEENGEGPDIHRVNVCLDSPVVI